MADDDWEIDAALLERWRAGDRAAGAELYGRHARVVIRFFRTKVRPDLVEDRVQETFTRMVEARDRIRDGRAFRAYVVQIAKYVLLEHLRGIERERKHDPSIDPPDAMQPGPTTMLGRKREHHLLLAGLRCLPIEHQIRLELCYFEGVSIVELAEIEETSPSTMRSRMSRSRVLLERAVAELDDSTALINSTLDGLDDWARDIRELLGGGEEQ